MARLYWMKLKKDFFKRHDIQVIEAMPNGKDYVLFYLKLLCESLDHEGNLRFSDTIPYNEDMLSAITHTNIDIVRSAMNLLIQLGLVEIFDDKTIYMREVEKFIGSESDSTERVRKHRALQAAETDKALPCNADVTKCNANVTQACYIDKRKEAKENKSIESRVKSLDVSMYESKERENEDIHTNAGACAHVRKSYEQVMSECMISEAVRPTVWEFIKHCQLNGRTLTNEKLSGIFVEMDLRGYDDKARIDALNAAINGGYYDIKRD